MNSGRWILDKLSRRVSLSSIQRLSSKKIMKHLFFLTTYLLTSAAAWAQDNVPSTGAAACADGKVRFFGQPGRLSRASARQMGPNVQSAGDPTIDVTYYGLDLRLTYAPNYLRGATTVTLRPASAAISQFFLDLNSALRVDSVKVGSPESPGPRPGAGGGSRAGGAPPPPRPARDGRARRRAPDDNPPADTRSGPDGTGNGILSGPARERRRRLRLYHPRH